MPEQLQDIPPFGAESPVGGPTLRIPVNMLEPEQLPCTVGDVMTEEVVAVERQVMLPIVAQLMRDNDVGILPVVDRDGQVVGCITDRDLVVRGLTPDQPSPTLLTVGDLMSSDVFCASVEQGLDEVIAEMGQRKVRRVPVVDEDQRLVGIISIGDVATRAAKDEALQTALERISRNDGFWHQPWR